MTNQELDNLSHLYSLGVVGEDEGPFMEDLHVGVYQQTVREAHQAGFLKALTMVQARNQDLVDGKIERRSVYYGDPILAVEVLQPFQDLLNP